MSEDVAIESSDSNGEWCWYLEGPVEWSFSKFWLRWKSRYLISTFLGR